MGYDFIHSKQLILLPQPESPWANEMVLNPAVIQDPKSRRIHMLFRATGPWPEKQLPGKPLPYPIFLGYAYSDDLGKTWQPDFSRPALKPNLEFEIDKIYTQNILGAQVVNYANGCVEDPRLFWLEGECYLIVASRMFPPGPYWIKDEPAQCAPEWIRTDTNPFGRAAAENITSNVLYKVDLDALTRSRYREAFHYVTQLTNPEYGENRDVLLFPQKLSIRGRAKYVCLHRPYTPHAYQNIDQQTKPSILICAADSLYDLCKEETSQAILASPQFPWEEDRVGGSAPLLKISGKEWLLCYHGRQDAITGYTQSFMILEEQWEELPKVKHRCSERLIIADQPWELPNKFKTPCVFVTGMIPVNNELLISYGAADEKTGVARIDYPALLDFIRHFDDQGHYSPN